MSKEYKNFNGCVTFPHAFWTAIPSSTWGTQRSEISRQQKVKTNSWIFYWFCLKTHAQEARVRFVLLSKEDHLPASRQLDKTINSYQAVNFSSTDIYIPWSWSKIWLELFISCTGCNQMKQARGWSRHARFHLQDNQLQTPAVERI
jgi:hypothetical protein